jgi:hypothetical protein
VPSVPRDLTDERRQRALTFGARVSAFPEIEIIFSSSPVIVPVESPRAVI